MISLVHSLYFLTLDCSQALVLLQLEYMLFTIFTAALKYILLILVDNSSNMAWILLHFLKEQIDIHEIANVPLYECNSPAHFA